MTKGLISTDHNLWSRKFRPSRLDQNIAIGTSLRICKKVKSTIYCVLRYLSIPVINDYKIFKKMVKQARNQQQSVLTSKGNKKFNLHISWSTNRLVWRKIIGVLCLHVKEHVWPKPTQTTEEIFFVRSLPTAVAQFIEQPLWD